MDRVYLHDGVRHVYILKDWSGETVEGTFYSQELTHAGENTLEIYKIEEVLDTRAHRGEKQVHVKWLNWHKRFSSWQPYS